jgi:hypothetical protein
MFGRSAIVWLVLTISFCQLGCWSTRKERILRQPSIEEYNLPSSDDPKVTEGPYYPDQRKLLPVQQRMQQQQQGPNMRGGAGGGPGSMGGGVGPTPSAGNPY